MIERISDWAKDPSICAEGREYAVLHSDPTSYYEGYSTYEHGGMLHPEWFFFRVNERWPDVAIVLASQMLSGLNDEVLSERCREARRAAIDLDLPAANLHEHIEAIRQEAKSNHTFEKAIFYLLRWRTGEKKRAAGPFIMTVMKYKKDIGHQNVEKEMIEWLQEKIPLEQWATNLEA